jgi:F-type H+-transporting ATPase subunit gamma
MAERLVEVAQKIRNMRQLDGVVTAMRGIAAGRAQNARAFLAGVDAYAEVVARAIGEALPLLPPQDAPAAPPAPAKAALILFCAEQGFVGGYNERLLEAAADRGALLFIIGSRGKSLATERGMAVAWSTPMATRAEGVAPLANTIADALYGFVARGAVSCASAVFSRMMQTGAAIERQSLFPVDLARQPHVAQAQPPLTTLQPGALIERLAAEYVFAQLCRAAMRAFAAENEARMLAMSAAKTNVEAKLDAFLEAERRLRQEEITTEIIELSSRAPLGMQG